jgi:hypothetical protein
MPPSVRFSSLEKLSPTGSSRIDSSDKGYGGTGIRRQLADSGAGEILLVNTPRPKDGVGESGRKRELFDDKEDNEKEENPPGINSPDQSEHPVSPDFRLVTKQ